MNTVPYKGKPVGNPKKQYFWDVVSDLGKCLAKTIFC